MATLLRKSNYPDFLVVHAELVLGWFFDNARRTKRKDIFFSILSAVQDSGINSR